MIVSELFVLRIVTPSFSGLPQITISYFLSYNWVQKMVIVKYK